MSIAHAMLSEFDQEVAGTRRVLSLVPDEHANWKPHEKSFSLGSLASHLGNMPFWGVATLTLPELDLTGPAAVEGGRVPFTTTAALLERFDATLAHCRAALVASSDDAMQAMWTLKLGSVVFFTMPRIAVLRTTVLNHMIHHRGQLTVYLRMLDVPLPDLYGPTADTKRG
jgi:uncharacterized damage-inducible protein DinB